MDHETVLHKSVYNVNKVFSGEVGALPVVCSCEGTGPVPFETRAKILL